MLKGHLLNERYEIQDMIGGGGMANVYLGKDTILNRNVAIKVLRLEYANDDEFIARFRREAHSATSLSHPNIVNIYDVGEEEHIYYMVMEYVDGMTLKQYIQTYGPAEVEEAIEITKQITAAMSHAHENDIVHRDIKPQNILIDEHKHVKVTDFGIAIALSATSLTQTNSVLGSVHYLSPEQARGGMATKKSDIYSIGIVLFELLTGRLPFSGQSAVSIALKHLQSETPSLMRWNPAIPQSVENIVLKATAKDPFHRYDDIYYMVDDLETALHPDRQNEDKFETPIEDDEEVTKAIPIITKDMYKNDEPVEDTIVHDTDHTSTIKSPHKKKGRWKGWVFGLLILIISLGSLAVFLLPKLLIPNDVEVVDVKGMKYEEAYSTLRELNLDVSQETMYSEKVPEGNVVRSEPSAGSTIKEGSQVKIYTSLGKERVVFEDYLGQNFAQVEKMLKEKGYKIIEYRDYSEKSEGEIIGQVQPNPGDKVIPEETSVIFAVSDGPEQVQVSKLVGDYLQEVHDYIDQDKRISLNEPKYEYSDSVPEGVVIRQEPEAYARVTPGTEVTVWVSMGKKEQAPVNKPVSFTVELKEEQTGQDHNVKIYVDDVNRNDTEIHEEETIQQTKQFNLTLTIAEGQEATYRVMLDDEVYLEESVPYEEGEGE